MPMASLTKARRLSARASEMWLALGAISWSTWSAVCSLMYPGSVAKKRGNKNNNNKYKYKC